MAKKILALVLAIMMIAALSVSAFADDTGSIKIANIEEFDNPEYTAYKIFDVTYDNSNPKNYAYSISEDSDWFGTVKTYAGTEDEETGIISGGGKGLKLIPAVDTDPVVYYVDAADSFKAADFAATLNKVTKKPTGTTLTGTGKEKLALGYWFVATTTGSLCNLTTTDPAVTIYDKNEPVTLDKEPGSEEIKITGSVQVGDKVPYEVTGKVPSTVGYDKYIYKVSDAITGAILQHDVVVKIGDTIITPPEGALVYGGNDFTLDLDMTDYQEYVGKKISITYSAIVNTSSLTAGAVENTAILEHSHDPNDEDDSKKEPDVKVILKTFTIDLTKVAENGTTPLAGAKFVLKNADGMYYTLVYGKNMIDNKGNDVSTNDQVVWVDSESKAMVVTTKADGKGDMEFAGLEAGTYELVEIDSPRGFKLPKDPFKVVITEGEERKVTETASLITKEYTYTAKVNGEDADIDNLNNVITTIANEPGKELPETGGVGTTIFYVVGSIFVLGAAVVLLTKKCA